MQKIYETSGYISDCLTHWTGHKNPDDAEQAFNNLCSILNSLELKFGKPKFDEPQNNIIFNDKNGSTVGASMICFTDTPIEQAHAHRKRYGSFGIGFPKEKIISYGAHPVFYYMEKYKESVKFILEKFREFQLKNPTDYKSTWYEGFFQPYNTDKNKNFPEYFEREWQISRVLYPGFIEPQLNGVIRFDEKTGEFYLNFKKESISNIIILEDYYDAIKSLIEREEINCEIIILIANK